MGLIRNNPIPIAIVLVIACWLAWNPVMNAFFGGHALIRNEMECEWVGQLDISKGYNPNTMGATPGPHKQAAIYVKLDMTSFSMKEYGGPGELFFAGENTARTIRIGGVQAKNFSAVIYWPPAPAMTFSGFLSKASTLNMTCTDELQFQGTLHRGTKDEYLALVHQLQSQTTATVTLR